MNRLVVNLTTGERRIAQLTSQEEAEVQARAAQEAAEQAQARAREQAERAKKNILDQLAAKIEADPTILDRIK